MLGDHSESSGGDRRVSAIYCLEECEINRAEQSFCSVFAHEFYASSAQLTHAPDDVLVLENDRTCDGEQVYTSPPTVLAGRNVPLPPVVGTVPRLSIANHPAT